ncbi:hypothetical protein J437_LFUL005973 [Ladona fulva]|uniref:Gamma-secretase subunit Aph-1 n=1 Tax=Ladona fulva TaxID=123851 RepID=A0A8K0NXS2_LADFU|nr:hypothetical protein J437_LFUL005973 [Ladona fulva]
MGLRRVSDVGTHASNSKHVLAYVSGLGFGVMSGAFSLVNVLADAIGPATMGLRDGTDMFFVTSAATALCIILLHTFWGVIFFSAVDKSNYLQLLWVLGSHMLVSCLTLLNRRELYFVTLIPAYIVMVITALIAYVVVGGSLNSFKESLKFRRTTLVVSD